MHYSQHHHDELLGGAIGAILGAVNNILSQADHLTLGEILHTVILAAVGACAGFLVTSLMKWVRKNLSFTTILKWIKKKLS